MIFITEEDAQTQWNMSLGDGMLRYIYLGRTPDLREMHKNAASRSLRGMTLELFVWESDDMCMGRFRVSTEVVAMFPVIKRKSGDMYILLPNEQDIKNNVSYLKKINKSIT
jgi:hypothetical protein